MSLLPLLDGVAATALAALVLSIWIATGTLLPLGLADDDEAALPVALLFGSAVTACALALFSLAGLVTTGVIVTGIAGTAVLLTRWRKTFAITGSALAALRNASESRLTNMILAAAAIAAWLSAIAPPRSADAMRYHLAHIRLIAIEGRWNPIQDFHFGLPFGWTLSYLPFELVGLPQGSQLLSLALLVVIAASCIRFLRKAGASGLAIAIPLAMLLHPFVIRTFVEAGAEPFAMAVVLAVALLLVRLPELSRGEAFALGFVAWAGIQSRYQLVAVGVASTLIFLFLARRSRAETRGLMGSGIAGLAVAVLLASPFYVMNWKWFGNPVWPLLISESSVGSSYSNLLAWHYARSLAGNYAVGDVLQSLWNLFSWPRLFPLALTIVVFVIAAFFSKTDRVRLLGWLGGLFLVMWIAMQPALYPKFVLMMLPVALLAAGMFLAERVSSGRFITRVVQVGLVALVTVTVGLSRESFAYAVTGDRDAFHRHTWFYPAMSFVNANTPRDARVLAIVRSGMTYYMERPYRRADPWIGGEVDWRTVDDGARLHELLVRDGYDYVVYDDRDWSGLIGGREMMTAIADAARHGLLKPMRRFDLKLYGSRATGSYQETRVIVFEVSSPAATERVAMSEAMASATAR